MWQGFASKMRQQKFRARAEAFRGTGRATGSKRHVARVGKENEFRSNPVVLITQKNAPITAPLVIKMHAL